VSELIFEEPPKPNPGGGRPVGASPIGRFLAALREHPGRWARFPQAHDGRGLLSRKVTDINRGNRYGVQAGEFEATSRKVGDSFYLYAKYVGGES